MCIEKLSPFGRVILHAFLGIASGIVFGLFFSVIIAWISGQLNSVPNADGPVGNYGFSSFLGMGFGSIIGAIVGAVHGSKK